MVVKVRPPPAEVAVPGEGADEGEAVLRVAVVVDRPVVVAAAAVRVGVVVHGRLVAVVMRSAMNTFWLLSDNNHVDTFKAFLYMVTLVVTYIGWVQQSCPID